MITPDSFRVDLPEFASTTAYPDVVVAYFLALANLLLNVAVWGVSPAAATNPPVALIDFGLELFVAHNLVYEKQSMDAATRGATPGLTTGPISSKSVDKVSISYDTAGGLQLDAGHWNDTTYGKRFINLARMLGSAPIQVGIGAEPGGFNGPAWSGPPVWPGWLSS